MLHLQIDNNVQTPQAVPERLAETDKNNNMWELVMVATVQTTDVANFSSEQAYRLAPAFSLLSCVRQNLLKVRSDSFLLLFSAFPNPAILAVPNGQHWAGDYRTLFAGLQRELCGHSVGQLDFTSVK